MDSDAATEFCASCGEFVTVSNFDEVTGWCYECSPVVEQQLHSYLAANADKLEYYIVTGQAENVYQAIDLLADPKNGHRPTCVVCGSIIKHAPRGSVFCRKNKECRRFSRRYIYLYTKKHMTKSEALATVLSEL
jgi:hypothetical protein